MKKRSFGAVSATFLPISVWENFISVWGGFCRSILFLILLRPLVVVGLLAASLGEVEGHKAADPAGEADEKHHHNVTVLTSLIRTV